MDKILERKNMRRTYSSMRKSQIRDSRVWEDDEDDEEFLDDEEHVDMEAETSPLLIVVISLGSIHVSLG